MLEQARALGITNILALRGDPPGGTGEFARPKAASSIPTSWSGSSRKSAGSRLASPDFPKDTSRTEGKHADWQHLKHKIDQGADFVITQLFFNNRDYFEFRDFLTSLGVTVPIVPGIMPILSASQIKRFVACAERSCRRRSSRSSKRRGDDDEAVVRVRHRVRHAAVRRAAARGRAGLHFYTLNKSRSTVAVVENLSLATSAASRQEGT